MAETYTDGKGNYITWDGNDWVSTGAPKSTPTFDDYGRAVPDLQFNRGDPGTAAGAIAQGPNMARVPTNGPAPSAAETVGGVLSRISGAEQRGYDETPPLFTAGAGSVPQGDVLWQYGVRPVAQAADTGRRLISAFGAGAGQALYETGNVFGGPTLGRDLYMGGQVAPLVEMGAGVPRAPGLPEAPAAGPKFVSERYAPPPVEGQTTLGRINDLLRHDAAEIANQGPQTQPNALLETGAATRPDMAPTAAEVASGSSAPITASKDGFARADAFYNKFDQEAKDGGSLTSNVANKVVDKVESYLPPPGMAEAFGAGDKLRSIVAKAQQYRDKPMSLLDVQAVDQQLGELIHAERDPINGMSRHGERLMDLQHDIRDITEKPAAEDVVGGQAGLDALAPAREAYSQAKKMQELERLWEKSQQTSNPTTAYKNEIKNLFNNQRRSAGFSAEEEAAVKDGAARGVIGGSLHLLGSRVLPYAAGLAEGGGGGGLGRAAAVWGITTGLGAGARALGNRVATGRFEASKEFLGQRIPQLPNQLGPQPP